MDNEWQDKMEYSWAIINTKALKVEFELSIDRDKVSSVNMISKLFLNSDNASS